VIRQNDLNDSLSHDDLKS